MKTAAVGGLGALVLAFAISTEAPSFFYDRPAKQMAAYATLTAAAGAGVALAYRRREYN